MAKAKKAEPKKKAAVKKKAAPKKKTAAKKAAPKKKATPKKKAAKSKKILLGKGGGKGGEVQYPQAIIKNKEATIFFVASLFLIIFFK